MHRATGLPFTFKMRAYDIYAEPQPQVARWAAEAACVLTVSRYNQEFICRQWGLAAERVRVNPDGVDVARITPVGRYAHRPFRIVSVARLVEKKGIAVLLDACRRLPPAIDFRCDVLGEGPLRGELEARITQFGLGERVSLLGSRPRPQVLAALESASVFVLACVEAANGDRDATPVALLEAMARSLPVVSTRLSGIPEIVSHEIDGLLVPPGDPQALADAIVRLATDRGLAETLRGSARDSICRRHTIGRTVDGLLAAFRATP